MADNTIKIGGELESMATGKIVAAASAIKDKSRNKTQEVINGDVEAAIAEQSAQFEALLQETSAAVASASESARESKQYLADLQEAITELPDGQAVSAQVAVNEVDIAGLKSDVVVDLSTRYATSYANLSAALTALNSDTATDAAAIKKSGVSIKFINSTTNKYEQWNLKASSWSTNTSDWALDADGSVTNGKLKLPFELEKPSSNEYVTQASEIGYDGEPLTDALSLLDNIDKQDTQSEEQAIIYETNEGTQVGKIDANGADFNDLKRGGQQVARMSDLPTKDSSIGENPSTTSVPTTKAVKDYVDDNIPTIKEDATTTDSLLQFYDGNDRKIGEVSDAGLDFTSIKKNGAEVATQEDINDCLKTSGSEDTSSEKILITKDNGDELLEITENHIDSKVPVTKNGKEPLFNGDSNVDFGNDTSKEEIVFEGENNEILGHLDNRGLSSHKIANLANKKQVWINFDGAGLADTIRGGRRNILRLCDEYGFVFTFNAGYARSPTEGNRLMYAASEDYIQHLLEKGCDYLMYSSCGAVPELETAEGKEQYYQALKVIYDNNELNGFVHPTCLAAMNGRYGDAIDYAARKLGFRFVRLVDDNRVIPAGGIRPFENTYGVCNVTLSLYGYNVTTLTNSFRNRLNSLNYGDTLVVFCHNIIDDYDPDVDGTTATSTESFFACMDILKEYVDAGVVTTVNFDELYMQSNPVLANRDIRIRNLKFNKYLNSL